MEWLKSIRKENGYTQKEVAEKAGISQASYCDIEKGKNRPRPETAMRISQFLGFNWTRFFEESGISPIQEQG